MEKIQPKRKRTINSTMCIWGGNYH